jgi:hypothetical protein
VRVVLSPSRASFEPTIPSATLTTIDSDTVYSFAAFKTAEFGSPLNDVNFGFALAMVRIGELCLFVV